MKYKAVIFDLDGTILDSQKGIAKAFQSALKAYGVEESVENIAKLIGPPLARTIITHYGFSEEDGAEAMKVHRKYLREKGIYECGIFDGVIDMLDRFKKSGVKMAIATNKPEEFAVAQLKYYKMEHYFEGIFGNNLEQTRGSKGDFVREAMESCKVLDSKDAVMVGDRKNDIQGGVENGLDTIAVLYGYGSEEELNNCGANYVVKTPLDVYKTVCE